MAIPVYVLAATTTQGSDVASYSATIPAHSSGDLLVLVVYSTAAGTTPMPTTSAPSGWTAGVTAEAGTSSAVRISAFVKTGDGAETTATISASTGNISGGATVSAYSDVNTDSPLDVNGSNVQESGTDIDSPSITTSENDTKVIFAYVFDDDVSTDADHDSDAGFLGTSRGYTETSAGGNGLAGAMADYDKVTAGATGTCTWSSNGDSDAGAAISFNIKGSSGYPQKPIGVILASGDKVIGVDMANVVKFIGVA